MSSASSGGALTADPNVTPMIDVLMVLLIIFMVIVPSSRKALDVQVPDPNPQPNTAPVTNESIVLSVNPGGQFLINKEAVAGNQLAARLRQVYDGRPDKVIFVKGDPQAKYQDIIGAMDVARGAGVKVIGFTPKEAAAAR